MLIWLKERNNKCDTPFDKIAEQVTRLEDAISNINQCKEIIKHPKKKIVVFVYKQVLFWKNYEDWTLIGSRKPSIYFKTNLYKFIKKYLHLKN